MKTHKRLIRLEVFGAFGVREDPAMLNKYLIKEGFAYIAFHGYTLAIFLTSKVQNLLARMEEKFIKENLLI